MLLQNLRARMSARLSGDREAGFTLIELLVVMLILGILAAIAIPAFFNQRDKGTDAQAKAAARTAQTAIETYATENEGSYAGATPVILAGIEETLQFDPGGGGEVPDNAITITGPPDGEGGFEAAPTSTGYTVTSTAGTNTAFSISRAGGTVTFSCTPEDGGCPEGGDWSS